MSKFQKGVSGNPKGLTSEQAQRSADRRRANVNWAQALREIGNELHPTDSKGRTWFQRAALDAWRFAADGRPSKKKFDAFLAIMDRVIGKPTQVNLVAELTPEQKVSAMTEVELDARLD